MFWTQGFILLVYIIRPTFSLFAWSSFVMYTSLFFNQIYFSHKAEQNVQEKFLYALLYAHNSCYCLKDLDRVMVV